MPSITEPKNLGDFLKYEAPNLYSRDRVTVASGQTLALGTVVGVVTATSKLKALDPGATDGTEIARQTTPAEGVKTTDAAPDARVLIGRPFSIDEDQNPYKLHGPGELVTGPLSNLYPF